MTQPTLWDILSETNRITRKSHPTTSQAAATELIASGRMSGNAADAFELVCKYPGRTAYELDSLADCEMSRRISKRLGGLKNDGRLRNGATRFCERCCRQCVTWYVVGS